MQRPPLIKEGAGSLHTRRVTRLGIIVRAQSSRNAYSTRLPALSPVRLATPQMIVARLQHFQHEYHRRRSPPRLLSLASNMHAQRETPRELAFSLRTSRFPLAGMREGCPLPFAERPRVSQRRKLMDTSLSGDSKTQVTPGARAATEIVSSQITWQAWQEKGKGNSRPPWWLLLLGIMALTLVYWSWGRGTGITP